jgi:rootletin
LESKLGQNPGQELYYGSPTGGGGADFGSRSVGPPNDLDDALWRLEQEKVRNDSLMHLNRNLRSELDETRNINEALSGDLQRLSDDWEKLTRQMTEREQMWKAEEQAYSDHYASEHSKLLSLWKKCAAAKRDFAEMKSSTGRDIAQLKNSLARMSNQISSGVITAVVASPSPQQVIVTPVLDFTCTDVVSYAISVIFRQT